MAITDEQRAAISGLALKALDTIEGEYGDDATLGDATIVYEVMTPDPEHDDELLNEGRWHSTTQRTTVAVGLLTLALQGMTESVTRDDD